MTPRESVIAVLVRHAEWCLDQADPEVVRDLPAWQRIHMRAVAREIAILLRAHFYAEGARALEARIDALGCRT